MDNGAIHRGDPVQALLTRTRRLHLIPLPAYAPELNPDEGVWQHLKHRLANGRPDSQAELMDLLADEICSPGRRASARFRDASANPIYPPFYPDCCISGSTSEATCNRLPAFKGSGDITSLAHADGYFEIPADVTRVEAGIAVTVTLF